MNEIYKINEKFFNHKDVFLASFPRSGNTWMRLLLSDLILQMQGFLTDTGGNIIPDVYRVDIQKWNQDSRINQLPFRIIKTHEPYQNCYNKVIYVFRQPADSLCSLYYYAIGRLTDQDPGLNEFCLSYVDLYCSHLQNYMDAKERKQNKILLIYYKNLKDSPEQVLNKVCNFLSLEVTNKMFQRAIYNQTFDRLKSLTKLEEPSRLGFDEKGGYRNFFRKGKVNSAKDELSAETVELIESKAQAIYESARKWELCS